MTEITTIETKQAWRNRVEHTGDFLRVHATDNSDFPILLEIRRGTEQICQHLCWQQALDLVAAVSVGLSTTLNEIQPEQAAAA